MLDILFRGKGTSGYCAGEWVYGYYCYDFWGKKDHVILPVDKNCGGYCEVTPETVGQYACMTDKKCRQIFTGDIVRDNEGKVYLVEFTMSGFFLKYSSYGYHELVPLRNFWHAHGPIIEIIGNIHDNPELWKESEGSENG